LRLSYFFSGRFSLAFASHDFSVPIPLRATKGSISAFAERVATQLQFKIGSPIEPLVVRLGGKIEYQNPAPLAGRLPESIIVSSQNDFTIFLPTMTSPERDRFTIAHELGHLILHYPLAARQQPGVPMMATRWVDENNEALKRTEWEANWFAAGFLMPQAEFIQSYRSGGLPLACMRFRVSSQAAEIRANSLGLGQ
jgi:hypothetical protein